MSPITRELKKNKNSTHCDPFPAIKLESLILIQVSLDLHSVVLRLNVAGQPIDIFLAKLTHRLNHSC